MTNQLDTLAHKTSVPHPKKPQWDKNFLGVDLLLAQFDHLIQTPADVDKLNATILDWAVRGQLVPQDPNDEPASVLLERIAAEKARLVEAGEIKKPKKLPSIGEDEIPFDIPSSWKWCRLGGIGDWGAGATPSRTNPEYYGGEIPWLKTGELNDGYINSAKEHITQIAVNETSVRLNKPNDILIAMYGATIGKLGILQIEATTNQACCACTPHSGVYNRYLFMFLRSRRKQLRAKGAGGAQPNISKQKIVESLFPLPPLAEQKRIVAKVDQLFAQTRVLADNLTATETSRTHFCASAIHALTSAQTPAQTQSAWQPMVDNLAALTADAQSVDQLKQAILQLAVSGRLVPQDPQDEPASVLLEQIAAEKARLVEAKEIKKPKKLDPIAEDEIPFEVPEGWIWVNLNELLQGIVAGKSLRAEKRPAADNEKGVLKVSAVTWGIFQPQENKALPLGADTTGIPTPKAGDLLITRANTKELVGAVVIVDTDYPNLILSDKTLRLDLDSEKLDKRFIMLGLRSRWVRSVFESGAIGTSESMRNISQDKMRTAPIALPPLAEQKRIVAKVDELHALCDQLAGEATAASTARQRLLSAILAGSV